MLDKNSYFLKYCAIAIIVVLSTGFICNTEIRSFLQHENDNNMPPNHTATKYSLFIPALLAGVFTSVGSAKIIELISPAMPLFARGIIFAALAALLTYPNAKGFYYTTLPATDSWIKKAAKSWRNYQCHFFSQPDMAAIKLLGQEPPPSDILEDETPFIACKTNFNHV